MSINDLHNFPTQHMHTQKWKQASQCFKINFKPLYKFNYQLVDFQKNIYIQFHRLGLNPQVSNVMTCSGMHNPLSSSRAH